MPASLNLMDKRRYFLRKVLNALLIIVLVASFNFILFRILPGNPARLLLPRGRWEASEIAKQAAIFHLNRPLWQQFGYYWFDMLQGKLGNSFQYTRPAISVVWARVPATLLLVGVGTIIAAVIGLVTGTYAGWRRDGWYDTTSTTAGMVLYSTPTLWVGLVLIMVFSAKLGWFPSGRMSDPGATYASWFDHARAILNHLVLPAMTFALVYIGQYHTIMRTSLSGVSNEDFVLTARAKGLSDSRVLWGHVVPNAMLPTSTVIMMNLGFIMSGAILTETVFNWPGIGLLSYQSMMNLDYPVLQAVFLLASVAVIIANLAADILYYYLDPRVRA
jgi:peptide/nickel transport system permease protein